MKLLFALLLVALNAKKRTNLYNQYGVTMNKNLQTLGEIARNVFGWVNHKDSPVTDDDPCNGVWTTKDTCDAQDQCTWCLGSAVADACWSIENSQRLPASVWTCDKKPGPPEVDCNADPSLKSKDACDAVDKCTWCHSAAAGDSCYATEDAKKLPSAIFQCDKLALRKI